MSSAPLSFTTVLPHVHQADRSGEVSAPTGASNAPDKAGRQHVMLCLADG